MTFTVRDLMIDVLPATSAQAHKLFLCEGGITMTPQAPPAPKPKPAPTPKPKRAAATAEARIQGAVLDAAELAPLSALREQLHQALHP